MKFQPRDPIGSSEFGIGNNELDMNLLDEG
jgi:hypothetical protein